MAAHLEEAPDAPAPPPPIMHPGLPAPLVPIPAPPPSSAPLSPAGNKPPTPKKPDFASPASPSSTNTADDQFFGGGFKKEERRSFKVEKIQNIPPMSPDDKVEMRSSNNVQKSDAEDKHLSYKSSSSGMQDLLSKKNMFEQLDKPKTEQSNNTVSKPPAVIQPVSSGAALTKTVSVDRTSLQSQVSRPASSSESGKPVFRTVLSVGGAGKSPLSQSMSVPPGVGNQRQSNEIKKANTLPAKAFNPLTEPPQPSVAPDMPANQSGIYSFATETNAYSSISNYSSATPAKTAPVTGGVYSDISNYSSAVPAKPTPVTGGAYSDISNYSSAHPNQQTNSQRGSAAANGRNSNSHDFSDQSGVYAEVQKPGSKQHFDPVYEAVDYSTGNQVGDKYCAQAKPNII